MNTPVAENKEMSIRPNPATNTITFSCNNPCFLKIYNTSGISFIEKDVKGNNDIKIDISELPKGIYIAQITDSKGKRNTAKFVKE